MTRSRAQHGARTIFMSVLAVLMGGAILAGCGGSSSGSRARGSMAHSNPTAQEESGAGGRSQEVAFAVTHGAAGPGKVDRRPGAHRLRAIAVVSNPSEQRARAGEGKRVTPRITGPNPCRLVSSTEARRIFGSTVAETEAPLGPTCIFKVSGQKRIFTLSVETVNIPQGARKMKKLERSTVAGHRAYCGVLGGPELLLSLGGKKALSVSAPCSVAQALAATAASHLKL